MRTGRPRLKSVLAVLLLWQLAAATLLATPAMASVHVGAAGCHAHGHVTDSIAPAAHSPGSVHGSDGDPNCCLSADACHCVGAQGTAPTARLLTTPPAASAHPAEANLDSPPLVRRITGVFRPPI